MKRRVLVLTGTTLLGLAIAGLPQVSLAQTSPLIGTSKLNLVKSKSSTHSLPRSATLTYTEDGQNIRQTIQGIGAQGNSTTIVSMHIDDGMPHPTTGSPLYDASAYTRADGNTWITARFKAGKLVEIGTRVLSQDGKTMTFTATVSQANGPLGNAILVYDKQ
jgi:hypothetical protein